MDGGCWDPEPERDRDCDAERERNMDATTSTHGGIDTAKQKGNHIVADVCDCNNDWRTPKAVFASFEGRRTLPETTGGALAASDAAGRRPSGILRVDAGGAAASSRGDGPNIISKNDMDRGGATGGRSGGSAEEEAFATFGAPDKSAERAFGSDETVAATGGAADGVGLSRPLALAVCVVPESFPRRSSSDSTRANAGC